MFNSPLFKVVNMRQHPDSSRQGKQNLREKIRTTDREITNGCTAIQKHKQKISCVKEENEISNSEWEEMHSLVDIE